MGWGRLGGEQALQENSRFHFDWVKFRVLIWTAKWKSSARSGIPCLQGRGEGRGESRAAAGSIEMELKPMEFNDIT